MRASVIVPALNEEEHIGAVVAPLMEAVHRRIVGHVVVVDDGSRDKTAEIARDLYATVVSHTENGRPRNYGKARAIRSGLSSVLPYNPDVVAMVDADIFDMTSEKLQELITIPDGKTMKVSSYRQGKNVCDYDLSGVRAFRTDVLLPLVDESHHLSSAVRCFFQPPDFLTDRGFFLEKCLNYIADPDDIGLLARVDIPLSSRERGVSSALIDGIEWGGFVFDYLRKGNEPSVPAVQAAYREELRAEYARR